MGDLYMNNLVQNMYQFLALMKWVMKPTDFLRGTGKYLSSCITVFWS
jgi:hypothetical protein